MQEHGYKISPGSLYPLLASLEDKGLLRSRIEQEGKTRRRIYRITSKGKKELAQAKVKLKELMREILK